MKIKEFNKHDCRICLEKTAFLDWNDEIFELCGTTYKDCYFKYTHLDELVSNASFTQLLCENCSTNLKTSYILVQKALESNKILEENLFKQVIISDEPQKIPEQNLSISFQPSFIILENGQTEERTDPVNFETIILDHSLDITEKVKDEDIFQMFTNDTSNSILQCLRNEHYDNDNESKVKSIKLEDRVDLEDDMNTQNFIPETPENSKSTHSLKEKSTCGIENKRDKMCQYCSKIVNVSYLKQHEDTHNEHRERIEICPLCGIKLYNKRTMKIHMKNIHQESREKKFKCDFCEKAYFNRGALNVHRRIHLGQMIPCPICSKQYYRQCDLDKHLTIHAAVPINTNLKERTKYHVVCKECGKSIRSGRFKEHQSFHLNKPVVKCNICNKNFFSLAKCSKHMRRVHQKNRNECTTYYEENNDGRRLTHLMLKQKERIQPC